MPTYSRQPDGRSPSWIANLFVWCFLPTLSPVIGLFILYLPFLIAWFFWVLSTTCFAWLITLLVVGSVFSAEPTPGDDKKRRSLTPAPEEQKTFHPLPLLPAPEEQKTFHLFPLLPTELRLQIWSHACFPRLVHLQLPKELPSRHYAIRHNLELIDQHHKSKRSPDAPYDGPSRVLTSRTRPPALLAVNFEAREVALKRYVLGFATKQDPRARVYVDFERDLVGLSDRVTIFPTGEDILRDTPDVAKVKWLCASKMRTARPDTTVRECFCGVRMEMDWQKMFEGAKAVCVVGSVVTVARNLRMGWGDSDDPKEKKENMVWWFKGGEGVTWEGWIKTDPWGVAKVGKEIYRCMD